MLINKVKAQKVVDLLSQYYKEKNNIANIDYPSTLVIGSKEWTTYMFYSCLLDYGMRSSIYHKNLVSTYNKYPDIFNPKMVVCYEEEELRKIIASNIHPRYPSIALKKWIRLSLELNKYDDINTILSKCNDYNTVENFIKNMGGYGQKTGNLLIRVLCENQVFSFNEVDNIPIDRHDIEISYLNGVILKNNLNNTEIKDLSSTYISCGKKIGVSANTVDKYLWEIGNTFCSKKDCTNCPLNINCRKKV